MTASQQRNLIVIAAVILCLQNPAHAEWPSPPTKRVEPIDQDSAALAKRVMPLVKQVEEANLIPGFQIALCTQDGTMWDGGFGIADLATGRQVDRDSRFYIASTSKALTGLAAARLNHRGELDFNATLQEAFVGVEFPAGYDPAAVRVRDLLTHTHGLSQTPISMRVAFVGNYTNQQLRDLIRYLPLRENREFRYANVSYDLAGLLLSPEETFGWKNVVEREVLRPLGMTHTTAYRSKVDEVQIAMPHDIGANGQARIKLAKFDVNMGPAGGHLSTAGDLIRLVSAAMNAGQLDGEQVIEADVIELVTSEVVPQNREFAIYRRHAWGIGWDIGTYGEETVIHRPGGFAGYYSNVAFLPEHGLGVAVLGNGGAMSASALEALNAAIFDEFLGKPDAATRLSARLVELQQTTDRIRQRAVDSNVAYADKPARALSAYVGSYSNRQFGTVAVRENSGKLEMEWGVIREELKPLQGSTRFHAQIIRPQDEVFFEFLGNQQARQLGFAGVAEVFRRDDN